MKNEIKYRIVKMIGDDGKWWITAYKKVTNWAGTVEYWNGSLPYSKENLKILLADNPNAKLSGDFSDL